MTDEVLAAPGLGGLKDRWSNDGLLVKWIQNPQEAAESEISTSSLSLIDMWHLWMDEWSGSKC